MLTRKKVLYVHMYILEIHIFVEEEEREREKEWDDDKREEFRKRARGEVRWYEDEGGGRRWRGRKVDRTRGVCEKERAELCD